MKILDLHDLFYYYDYLIFVLLFKFIFNARRKILKSKRVGRNRISNYLYVINYTKYISVVSLPFSTYILSDSFDSLTHIVIHRLFFLLHNSSVWLDTLYARRWDRNLSNFTLDLIPYRSANKRTTSAWEL